MSGSATPASVDGFTGFQQMRLFAVKTADAVPSVATHNFTDILPQLLSDDAQGSSAITPGEVYSYSDKVADVAGLDPDTLYYFWLEAIDAVGRSSGVVPVGEQVTPPAVTDGFGVTTVSGTTVTAEAGLSQGGSGSVYESLSPSLPAFLDGVPVSAGVFGDLTVTVDSPGFVYRVKVDPGSDSNYTFIESRSDILARPGPADVYYRVLTAGTYTFSLPSHMLFFTASFSTALGETFSLDASGTVLIN
jgi:hypothetical protein